MNATPDAPDAESRPLARAHAAALAGQSAGGVVALSPDQRTHLTRVRLLADPRSIDAAARQAATTIYAAVPKGGRADWMVEKLCELGVTRFVPILCERGVVEPGGNKLERFARLAREAAKQSRRRGVMEIGPLTPLADAVVDAAGATAAVLATEMPGRPLSEVGATAAFIGPEGGWTPGELAAFAASGVVAATLGDTILRVETAAVACAAVWAVAGVASRP